MTTARRVLVLGATGYIGSRLVPTLLAAGHTVVAASTSPRPARFAWGGDVDWVRCDVGQARDVRAAARAAGADTLVYLVHTLDEPGFTGRDRVGAENVRREVDRSEIGRVVYLSGLVPPVPEAELSPHIASRLEVERILLGSRCSSVALRAGVVVGAGSTSYEVVRQLGQLLVVQPVPDWLRSRVQPIAVTDAVRALAHCVESHDLEGAVDIGGPDALPYPELLRAVTRAAGLWRVQVPVPAAPVELAGMLTAGLVQAPYWTVTSLVESLRHDMVCREGHRWQPTDGPPLLPLATALARAEAGDPGTLEARLPSDPEWTRTRAPGLDEADAPAALRAGVSLALHRLRGLLG